MRLSKSHLDEITKSQPGELEIVLHPTKPLIIVNVVGTTVLLTMEPQQVDTLVARLQKIRGMLRAINTVEKSTPPTVEQ